MTRADTARSDAQAAARAAVDTRRCTELAVAMVQCDTRNPPGNESSAVGVLTDVLCGLGARTEVFEPAPGRISVLGTIGDGCQPVLLINGHVDVVAVEEADWTLPPFGGVLRDGRLYGRGACDMKGGIAAALEAVRACQDAGVDLRCDLAFHLVADEETGGRWGTSALLKAGRIRADAAIVPEPSELAVGVAERGALLAEVTVSGRAAHGSDPAAGHSAIADAARLVQAVHLADFGTAPHPLLGSPTCNVGTISGGTMPNIVASSAKLRLDRRVLPGCTEQQAVAELEAVLDRAGTDIDRRLEVLAFIEGSEVDPGHPFVRAVRDATDDGAGPAPVRGLHLGTDARFLRNRLDIPAVIYGPGSMTVAHTADEYVPVPDLTVAARTFAAVYAGYGR
ncbi:M20 family metallopeptidase [Pseudonocardia kujensis]|uniref:M20 family metallopeptidase n=1 Tax=Pseudonocardia kujensis TaxID=1128675 RepID=UPI001E42A748|nr:M20 family metallopeptidase [Pseudonocardia kujensis]MCE0763294.1 M20 family metallopeptidase [Pseudonocardia kujensis]